MSMNQKAINAGEIVEEYVSTIKAHYSESVADEARQIIHSLILVANLGSNMISLVKSSDRGSENDAMLLALATYSAEKAMAEAKRVAGGYAGALIALEYMVDEKKSAPDQEEFNERAMGLIKLIDNAVDGVVAMIRSAASN